MFAIEVQSTFYASHALRLPAGDVEPAHSHAFTVTAKIIAQNLDPMETVLDFHDLQRLLAEILAPWSNQFLNNLEPFRSRVNPSAERIAEQIGQRLVESLRSTFPDEAAARALCLAEVRLTEAPGCLAIWSPDPA